jgi:hypothetical protein
VQLEGLGKIHPEIFSRSFPAARLGLVGDRPTDPQPRAGCLQLLIPSSRGGEPAGRTR